MALPAEPLSAPALPSFDLEEELMDLHGVPVAGIDEAGRGPWAGPVVVAAVILTQVLYKKVDLSMALNGAIGGLVSITAGPDTPTLGSAILIGAVGGAIVVFAVPLLDKLKIDDVVGAIPAHLLCGIWGTMAVPLTNDGASFVTQAIGVAAVGAFVIVASAVVWMVLKFTIGIRAAEEDEDMGLDKAELGLEAYPEFGRGAHSI